MQTRIVEDLKEALLSKDALRVSTLRMLLAAVVNKEKEKRYKIAKESPSSTEAELQKKSALSDEEIQQVVTGEAKKRKESIEAFEKGGRKDLVEKEQKELEILQRYLPEQLSEEEIRKLVQEAIASTSASSAQDMGKVIAALMARIKGRADGTLVSKIVKELLQ